MQNTFTSRLTTGIALLSLVFMAGTCSPDPEPAPTPTPSTPSKPSTPATPTTPTPSNPASAPTVSSVSTLFLAGQNHRFSKSGEWTTEGFTINKTTTFTFYFAAQYNAQAAVIDEAELKSFQNNGSFRAYDLFDNKFGVHSVTLGAGKYYVAVRNTSSGANTTSYEFDYEISVPASDRASFNDVYFSGAKSLNGNGSTLYQGFTVQSGFRYFIDGCSTDIDTYILPEGELNNFINARQFKIYTDYDAPAGGGPGLWEIKLPPGNYYFGALNQTDKPQAIVYQMERWRVN